MTSLLETPKGTPRGLVLPGFCRTHSRGWKCSFFS